MSTYGDIHKKAGYGAGRIGWGKKPAIIAVDFQRVFTDIDAPLGGGNHIRRALKNSVALLHAARSKKIPIIYTVVAYRKDKKDMGFWPVKIPKLAESVFASKWTQVSEEVPPEPDDIVLIKKMPSAFFGTELLNVLVSQRIDTNVIVGVATSGCVRASIVDSFSHGFRTIVVGDCCGDQSEEPHHANLIDVDNRYADVISLEKFLEDLKKF